MSKTVGVVLGGGGARGLAHMGVLQSLEAAGISPGVVVGVSMGAVIGATYAARHDWEAPLHSFDNASLPGHVDLHETEGLALVRGVVRSALRLSGQALSFTRSGGYEEFGRAALAELIGSATFESLRIPFAAIATNLTMGNREVFSDGDDLAGAIIASSALPVLTSPVLVGDQRYYDGGFVDPAPIDVARQLGADVVVMVNVGTPHSGESDVDGPLSGAIRAFEVGAQRFVDVRQHEADLLVAPIFPAGLSWLSFDRGKDMVDSGRRAMDDSIDELHALLD